MAFKLFKLYNERTHLSKSDIEYMNKINTKRILLPKYSIREDSLYETSGYAMDFISNSSSILNVLMDDLFNELGYIELDIKTLSEYLVSINDLTLGNYIYSNGLYLIDPGNYEIDKINHLDECYDITNIESLSHKDKEILVENHNYKMINEFILKLLILSYLIKTNNINDFSKLSKYLRIKKQELKANYYLDVLEKEGCENMTVKEYVKSIYSKVR